MRVFVILPAAGIGTLMASGGMTAGPKQFLEIGGVPVLGSWKIDETTGKTEFCISGTAQCTDATPQ